MGSSARINFGELTMALAQGAPLLLAAGHLVSGYLSRISVIFNFPAASRTPAVNLIGWNMVDGQRQGAMFSEIVKLSSRLKS